MYLAGRFCRWVLYFSRRGAGETISIFIIDGAAELSREAEGDFRCDGFAFIAAVSFAVVASFIGRPPFCSGMILPQAWQKDNKIRALREAQPRMVGCAGRRRKKVLQFGGGRSIILSAEELLVHLKGDLIL